MTLRLSSPGLAGGGTVAGNLVITGTLNVQGIVTFDVAQAIQGTLTIDLDDAEALLVRKDGDAGDVLVVDTNSATTAVIVGSGSDLQFASAAESFVLESTGILAFKQPGGVAVAREFRIHQRDDASNRYLSLGVTTFEAQIIAKRASGGGTLPLELQSATGPINFQAGSTTTRWNFAISPYQFAPNAHNSYDIGTTLLRVKNIYATGFHGWTAGSDGEDDTPPETFTFAGGNVEVFNEATLAAESFQDGNFSSFANWANSDDWSEGSGNYVYLHSAGSGQLQQVNANLAISVKSNRWYKFTYTVSNVTDVGTMVCFFPEEEAALTQVNLDVSTAGTRSVVFQSTTEANPDFIIEVTSTDATSGFTLDDVILKEIIGGDVIVAGKLTGGGTSGLSVDQDGNVILAVAEQKLGIGIAAPTATVHIENNTSGRVAWVLDIGSSVGNNDSWKITQDDVVAIAVKVRDRTTAMALPSRDFGGTNRIGPTVTIGANIASGASGAAPGTLQLIPADVGTAVFMYADDDSRLRTHTLQPSGNTGTATVLPSAGKLVIQSDQTIQYLGSLGSDGNDETPPEQFSVLEGNLEVFNSGSLGSETLTDGDMSSSTNWAGATDWSDTISGTTTYTHSAGNGTLTQTATQRVTNNEGSNARWYKFTYTVSAVTNAGTNVLTITNAFAAATVTLDISSNATRSVIFQAHATTADTADFVLSATSDTGSDTFTLDDLILKEIIGGNIILGGKLTGGGSNGLQVSGGGTVSTFEKDLGTVGASETIDWRDGNHQKLTLDENLTIVFVDPDGPASLVVHFVQDGSGTNTVSWPSNVDWEGGTAPTISTGAAAIDIITLYFDGSRYYGGFLQDFS